MTASDSSSSAAVPTDVAERPHIDLVAAGLLQGLPAAFLEGRDADLLAPLRFLPPGALPEGDPPPVDRGDLARGLAAANASYGHPAAERLAAKLARPETRVVVSGQQPGLLGGPLYTLLKAVAAVRWVRRIEATGVPAMAVFWVATEDHDYREVARIAAPGVEGLLEADLGPDPAPLLPVGMRTLGSTVEDVLAGLAAANPGERFSEWIETLRAWYRPEARFGEAFSRLLVGLLGEECPLVLDAMLPAVKEAERPWLERVVGIREELERRDRERERAIAERGHDLQVQPQPGSSPLFFLHHQERRRLEWRGATGVGLRGDEAFAEPVAWLERAIAENPAAVSPGVLARPAIQDAILGTHLQVMGPGEVSYLPQVAPLYECLGLAAPWVALRPQALVLARHQLDKLEALPLTLEDLVAPKPDLDRLLAAGKGSDLVAPVRREVATLLENLRAAALGVDRGLEGPWKKTSGQIERALHAFEGRVDAAAARQNEVSRRRAEDLAAACRPRGKLQERMVTTGYFPGKFGAGFAAALLEQLDVDPTRLQVIVP